MIDQATQFILIEMANINIIPLTSKHAKDIADVFNVCFSYLQKWTPAIIKNDLRHGHLFFGAVGKGKLYGAVKIIEMDWSDAEDEYNSHVLDYKTKEGTKCFSKKISIKKFVPKAELKLLCMHQEFRGMNLGNKIVEFVVRKYKHLFLETDTHTSPEALHLYKKFGFKDIDCMKPAKYYYR